MRILIRHFKKLLWLLFFSFVIIILKLVSVFENDVDNPENRPDWVSVRLADGQRQYVDEKGVRVIVGHYAGPDMSRANINKDMLNTNNFDPKPDAGKNGQPVMVPPKDLLKMQQFFQVNAFNLLASDRIPLNRTLRDVRNFRCLKKKFDFSKLPSASVIIVFHNEAWSTLLRTVWSVINRSPKELLREIILVDDASDREFLKDPLQKYVDDLPVKTKLIRMTERFGLIKARMLGAESALGESLVFLDAHCECTVGWLENLLERIADDRTRVVCPIIDIINKDTFAFTKIIESSMGAFNWHLSFRWFYLSTERLIKRGGDMSQPIRTPTMAGGLFAIDKKYFFELGGYDTQMYIWGGENIEISFRIWQCGGKIEIIPCSHVGHVFRMGSPYNWPGGSDKIISTNFARIALVWMDEWRDFYLKFSNSTELSKDIDVSERIQLRNKLKCQNFKWYLDNIWPEHCLPTDDAFFGKMINQENNKCLYSPGGHGQQVHAGNTIYQNCTNRDDFVEEMFIMKTDGSIMANECVCLEVPGAPPTDRLDDPQERSVRLHSCNGRGGQQWKYDTQTSRLQHNDTGWCLTAPKIDKPDAGLMVRACDKSSSQKWLLKTVKWKN